MPRTDSIRKWRRAAFQEQRGLCLWCGIRMFLPHEPEFKAFPKRQVTAEHVIPKAHLGQDRRYNIAAACSNCNTKRRDYTLEEWLGILPQRLKDAGNLAHFDVCLNWLTRYANAWQSANPPSGPDGNSQTTVPPQSEQMPAPQG